MIIIAEPKEIADLLLAIRDQQYNKSSDSVTLRDEPIAIHTQKEINFISETAINLKAPKVNLN